ncbi:M23 family metallopeptidase [Sphingomonas sp. ac-8]|uniref:M23 family metallopeptidase n=1 Tax=Sphingomonas sp. ac-8 TaxID=3242977 RepID=UPI003A7FB923
MIISTILPNNAGLAERFRRFFAARDVIVHDGRTRRRIRIAARTQAIATAVAALTLGFSGYGVANAAVDTGLVAQSETAATVDSMRQQVRTMQANVAELRQVAAAHAARIDQRQALIAAVLTGEGDPARLADAALAPLPEGGKALASVTAPLERVEQRQARLAAQAQRVAAARLAETAGEVRKLGLRPEKLGMGGPFEPVSASEAATVTAASTEADSQFRNLFMTWKKLDTLEQAAIAIPSLQPVDNIKLSSNFGVRSDPFRGTAAMHAGIDLPGPLGTPVYATADGIVGRAQRAGGYGNLIELNHGKGIQTRYGHLSKILVSQNTRVRRGQLIGLMGSTGRSTGSHLHYEVRINGAAVNPVPYLQAGDQLLAAQDRAARNRQLGVGGPAE